MITNKGKEVVGKYLLGQVNDYAAYIAVGCGAKPLQSGETPANGVLDPDRTSLEFEMFRSPVIAKGFVVEGGVTKLIYKAELPQDQQYKITEVGLYPAQNNVRAGAYDSKLIASFVSSENWKSSSGATLTYQTASIVSTDGSAISIPVDTNGAILPRYIGDDNVVWAQPPRKSKYEFPRMGNQSVIIDFTDGPQYITSNSIQLDLGKNSGEDKINVALVTVARELGNDVTPPTGTIYLELSFYNANGKKAVKEQAITFDEDNRYVIWSSPIQDFTMDAGFLWGGIVSTKVALDSSTVDTLIVLDGIRLENISTENPIYGLVGYNILVTPTGQPVTKRANSSNFIEYRFGLNIQ